MSCPDCKKLEKRIRLLENALHEAHEGEARLREYEDKYRRHLEQANSIIMRIDPEGNILSINQYAVDLLGFSREEMIGKNLVGTIVPEKETTGRDLRMMVRDIGQHPERYLNNINENLKRDGSTIWINWSNKPVYGEDGGIEEILCIGNDFTEFKRAEEQLEYIAFHDPLTGLYNRKMFLQQFEECLRQARRYNTRLAMLFVDLDNFKKVNDTLGHECGDELLRMVAERLREAIRDSDVIGRFGGDEFVLLLNNPGDQFPEKAAARLQTSLSSPYSLSGTPVDYISPSIGIALFPDHADSVADLVRRADEAMYAAKKAGKNRYTFFSK